MAHSKLITISALLVTVLVWPAASRASAAQGPSSPRDVAAHTIAPHAAPAPLMASLSPEPDPQRGGRGVSGGASRSSSPSRGSVSPQRGSVSPSRGASPSPSRGASPAPSRGASPSPSRGASPAPSRGASPAPSRGASPSPSPSRGAVPSPSRGVVPQPSRGAVVPQPARPSVAPTASSPGVRTYDAPRTGPTPGVGSVTGYGGARQTPEPSGLGGPSGRIAPVPSGRSTPSTPVRGGAAATPSVVDLTGSARAPRVRFPEIGSGARGPAARRGEALSGSPTTSRPRGTGTYDETRTRAVADGLESARQRQVQDADIQRRYRGPANDRGATGGLSARERDARGEPGTPAERARRAPGSERLRQAFGDDQSGLEARRSALLRRNGTTTERTRGGSSGAADGRRVGRLAPALPAADPAVENARRGASIATGVAVDVGLGVTVGVFGGSSGAFCGTGWPYYGFGYGYGGSCGWYPGWSWGFSFCWSWGASYWSPYCFGYWPWWNSPYYCNWYSPAFYYPVYYSYLVYTAYSEPVYYEATPSQTTYVEEAAPVAGEAAVAATEAVPTPDADLQAALSRAASYYLNLGDHAFRDGRYADAVHFYAKAVEYAPDQGVLYMILADALFATGDYHYAAYALRKAVELDPTLFDRPVDKRTFYTDPEDFDRQLATLELYLQDHFIDDDARLVLAANYLFGDRPAAAVDLLQESFSETLRGSPAGKRVLEAARAIQYGR